MNDKVGLNFLTQIYSDIEEMPNRIKFPDRSNRSKGFFLLMMWKQVEQLASKKYDNLLKQLIDDEQLTDPKSMNIPGNYVLAETPKIAVNVNVSQPRREFDVGYLAMKLEKDYKVPQAITRQLVEEAKRPGATNVRRLTVIEKGS